MMNLTRTLILATFMLMFAACGGSPEPRQSAPAPTDQPTADPQITSPADKPVKPVEVVEESAGDDIPAQNQGSNKIVLAEANTPVAPAPQKFKANTDYIKLTTAQGTSSPPDVVEVAEVFWYGCPHCFNFDPIIQNWAGNLPDGVRFIRLPVMWNATNEMHARIFYTLEALGKIEEMHGKIFNEIHVNKDMLTNEASILNFVSKHGISTDDFKKTFRSYAVESKLKRAKNLTQRYRIQSVPLLVINGTYLTSGEGIKNFDDMMAVADELIARELENR